MTSSAFWTERSVQIEAASHFVTALLLLPAQPMRPVLYLVMERHEGPQQSAMRRSFAVSH